MTINEHIEKIKDYFGGFNIANNTAFILAKFPTTWTTFDEKFLNEHYGVYTGKRDEGTYFITEIENGTDKLFEAVQYVINANKSIEEKQVLLQLKAKELTDLFVNESLEKLKTLEFTFVSKKPRKTNKNSVKSEKDTSEVKAQKDTEKEVTPTKNDTVIEENKKESTTTKKKKNNNSKDSSAMSFMKTLTKE